MSAALDDLLQRAGALIRRIEDARAALGRGVTHDLTRAEAEVAALCDLALRVRPEERPRAVAALERLDGEIAAVTTVLATAREALPPQPEANSE